MQKVIVRLQHSVAAIAFILISAMSLYAFFSEKKPLPRAVIGDIFVFLASAVIIMALELKKSLKKSLYLYKNIMLIALIIFALILQIVLEVVFLPDFFSDRFGIKEIYSAILEFPRQFSYYAAFVILSVCLVAGISNISLMLHEGFRPKNALSVAVAAIYIGATVAIYSLSDWFEKSVYIRYGMDKNIIGVAVNTSVTLFLLLMLCYFECVLAATAIMGYKAARQKPEYDKDYIIILGCSIDKKGGLLPLLKGRVNRAVRFAWEQEIATGKPLKYVPSGGQGQNEVMSEGSAMELYLLTKGAESYEVFPEKKSTDTYENMAFSKEIIDKLNPNAEIAFATTNYHMLRSGIIARKAGINAEGIAGDTKWYFWPNGFIREFFGILALNVKAHINTAVITAIISVLAGFTGYIMGV